MKVERRLDIYIVYLLHRHQSYAERGKGELPCLGEICVGINLLGI